MAASDSRIREFGIDFADAIPWGTHLCQFFETKQDLIDILVPYFVEGLRSNEFCMWVTSPPLEVVEAKEALNKAVPDLDEYFNKGQLEIISHNDWYLLGGKFDPDRVLRGWVEKERNALERGFVGMRLTGNSFWVERNIWKKFIECEEAINSIIGKHRMIAVCTYYLKNCSANDFLDVVSNHIGTLIRQGNKWMLVEEVTARRQAEEALRDAKERLQSILNSMDDGVTLVGLDGTVLDCNEASIKMLGLTREEFIGKNVYDIVVPEDRQRAIEGSFKVLEAGRTLTEVGVLRKGNAAFSAEISVTAICDKNGKPIVFLGVTRDITKRKKMEEELRENEELYRTLFDNSNDGFILVEPLYDGEDKASDFRFLKVNRAFEQQTGTKADLVLGKRALEITPDIDRDWVVMFDEVAKTGKSMHYENYNKLVQKWHDAYFFPYAKGLVGILFRDITDRKTLETKLQDKERLAAIGATAGMVGHDIRNPLQAIVGDVYLIKDDLATMPDCNPKESMAESLSSVEKNVGYINKIVADLQDYARTLNPEYSDVVLPDLIGDLAKTINMPENIKLSINVESLRFKTDPTFIQRAITNLANNAIQAMPKGGNLIISAYAANGKVSIVVEDTGTGIPEEVKPKLFTPMVTTKSKGQGLGLAVVKRLVEALNGTITFESQAGKGTTFTIDLPC